MLAEGVELFVQLMELALNVLPLLFVEVPIWNGNIDSVLLPQIAHIGRACEYDFTRSSTLSKKDLQHMLLKLAPCAGELVHIHLPGRDESRLDEIMPQVAHEHAPGGEMSPCRWHNDTRYM